jgi:anti-sigma B factor antagonist
LSTTPLAIPEEVWVSAEKGKFENVRTGEIGLERTDAGLAVLTISGEHDLNTAPELRRHFDGLLEDDAPILVDLSPATFVDSSILGVVLDAHRRAGDAKLGFAVLQAPNGADAVARVLEITGLREELPVHKNRDDAEGAAAKPEKPPS